MSTAPVLELRARLLAAESQRDVAARALAAAEKAAAEARLALLLADNVVEQLRSEMLTELIRATNRQMVAPSPVRLRLVENADHMWGIDEARKKLGLSRRAFLRARNNGDVPKPDKFVSGRPRWRPSSIIGDAGS
jgi:predicted DNA-binding transcriptional regulator AlpA